ncbi:hypothetical protein M433DRAFT_145619 [Acidomyces richmondensis BFW]|nr:MAG: hypothetical protein FE78DRAFT_76901 [Acidomyces sp. 'richmondensis']KYG43668.1 hypothetical protein M433DRAFT_145619 [Acidomyces richmondensis BFW]
MGHDARLAQFAPIDVPVRFANNGYGGSTGDFSPTNSLGTSGSINISTPGWKSLYGVIK